MQLAGANSALALAMTVISNLLGILIVSFKVAITILWLHLYIYLESHLVKMHLPLYVLQPQI